SVPFPVFQAFDAPPADVSCVRRSRSNTPMQALTLLNEPLFLESARALALKTLREGGATDEARLTFAFRRVLSRKPSLEEMNVLRDFLRQQTARIAAGELKTNDLLDAATDKPLALPPGVSPQAYAAWTTVARALLNLDEAITKE
ncbi:MAG: DUF1553 domain-containing protein, partial [Blastocatellia bacterium]